MILALLAACATPDPAADRAAFLALECGAVRDERLRDECLLFATKAEPERAGELCAAVAAPALRDECVFLSIDARRFVGEEAVRGCRGAGKFAGACHANAISREVSALPPMEEAALTAAIERIVAQYRPPRPGEVAEIARRRAAAGGASNGPAPSDGAAVGNGPAAPATREPPGGPTPRPPP